MHAAQGNWRKAEGCTRVQWRCQHVTVGKIDGLCQHRAFTCEDIEPERPRERQGESNEMQHTFGSEVFQEEQNIIRKRGGIFWHRTPHIERPKHAVAAIGGVQEIQERCCSIAACFRNTCFRTCSNAVSGQAAS
jgi:hypothetical protein